MFGFYTRKVLPDLPAGSSTTSREVLYTWVFTATKEVGCHCHKSLQTHSFSKRSPVSSINFSEGIVFMTSMLSSVFNELQQQVGNNNYLIIHHLTTFSTNLP